MSKLSAIRQMMFGKRGNLESVSLSQEYWQSMQTAADLEKQFLEKLAPFPELIELYKKLCDVRIHEDAIATEDYYIDGFSFGALLGIEIFQKSAE